MAVDTPVNPSNSVSHNGEMWMSIYDIPNKQRATFYTYAVANDMLRKVVVPREDVRCDDFKLVEAVPYYEYYAWIINWDSKLVLPSMKCDKGVWYTLPRIDIALTNRDIEEEEFYNLQNLRNKLSSYMIFPFRHNTMSISTTSKIWTWYELEKDMLQISDEIRKGAKLQGLLASYVALGKYLTDGILLSCYDYARPN